jgi:diketogulonate reductase-like aldo/keto reductase
VIFEVRARSGAVFPSLGLGTWRMGESASRKREEVSALRMGLDLGMRLVDTAEMYGDGGAEEVVAEAIAGRRDEVFLVSKVLPHHATFEGTIRACEASLTRLATDRIDLYLLHWPGPHPLAGTVEAFRKLRADGKILHWGVSNFDVDEMEAVAAIPDPAGCSTNQVLYNLDRRGPERRLFPWCRARGIPIMAYSPLEQGRLRKTLALGRVAARHGATGEQIALAWTLRLGDVVAIPKATKPDHVRANARAADLVFTEEDLAELDRAYPAPERDAPLETL